MFVGHLVEQAMDDIDELLVDASLPAPEAQDTLREIIFRCEELMVVIDGDKAPDSTSDGPTTT